MAALFPGESIPKTVLRHRRGMTSIELLVSSALLAVLLGGMAVFLNAGKKQQQTATDYGQVQTTLRGALRRITRTIRHGYAVENPGSSSFSNTASSSSQVIVLVPEPSTASSTQVQDRCYLSGATVYFQRADEAASNSAGTVMATGVTALTFNYWKTTGTTSSVSRTAVDGAPDTATEVQVTMTATYGRATTTECALATLRNKITGL